MGGLHKKGRTVGRRAQALHGVGLVSFPWFGWFLVGEARRLELDAPCVASLAAYAAAHVVYLAASPLF